MPKTITLLRLFIASPSDVNSERNIIKVTIDELNIAYAYNNNLKLEVVEWNTHVYPSIGEDAQDVINNQINDDYDIFVGLMWSRFGVPTKRDSSGTKEEFERAYNKYAQNNDSIFLLQYFKNAPIPFDEIDPEQIQKIKEFKEELKSRGFLYSHFTQTDEFEKIFRLNMMQLLNKFLTNNPDIKKTNTISQVTEDPKLAILNKGEEQEELGMFEYIDNALLNMSDMEVVLGRITKYMTDLGANVNKRTAKLNSINDKPHNIRIREARKLIDLLADNMLNFNQRIKIEIPILNEHFSNAIKNYNNAILIFNTIQQDESEKDKIRESLTQLKTSIQESTIGIETMKNSIIETPSLTTKYAKAKKEGTKVLSELNEEFDSYSNLIDELTKTLNNIA